jgi:methylenetetrahydrofolate dehydrogenase (NADP+)/methenyltetrahydrofolate cyclohydrolase
MGKIIDGKLLSQNIKNQLKIKVQQFYEKHNRQITLAVILVGENPASQVYVKNKIKATEYVGMKSLSCYLPENATESEVSETVLSLANDNTVDGILVQLPLPKHLDENKILGLIPANKDVDGFLAENVGNLLLGQPATIACTPFGVIKMLESENIETNGKNAVVIGRSNIVGKPMARLLLKENCNVTVLHSKTTKEDMHRYIANADIIVVAVGRPYFLNETFTYKNCAVIVDVGINRVDGKLVGDASPLLPVRLQTPVPGGVGLITRLTLLDNLMEIYRNGI